MILVPSKMGRMNRLALLTRVHQLGVASRADLAKSLGLSQPTCGKIVDGLLRAGLLERVQTDAPSGPAGRNRRRRLGRPGQLVRLNRSKPRFLAIELGVTSTRLAPLPLGISGEDQWTVSFATPTSAEAWGRELRRVSTGLAVRDLAGVLMSVPGILDERAGRVLFSPNLHWTEQADLAGVIRRVWAAPVVLVQEERALALGHQYVTPEREDFLLVDFGDGVGGAVLVAGRAQATSLPISGELGHTPVRGNTRRCGCGAVGCLETLVSTGGLLRSFQEAHPTLPATWSALADRIRDKGIEEWLSESLEATAVVIAGALNVIGLRHVVLTGSLTELPQPVLDLLTAAVRRGAMWARFGTVEVEAAPRRRAAGLVAVGIERLVMTPPTPAG